MARILVTGASRGLGRALALELTRRGHEVVASARQLADLVNLEVTEKIALDVTVPSSVRDAVAKAGDMDVVVNNAALGIEGPVEAVPVDIVQSMFETNVFGPLRVIQGFLPGMRSRQRGLIVNISSLAGQFAPPLQGVYSASKAALERLSEALNFEVQHFRGTGGHNPMWRHSNGGTGATATLLAGCLPATGGAEHGTPHSVHCQGRRHRPGEGSQGNC